MKKILNNFLNSGLGYALAISHWISALVMIGYLYVSGKYKYTLSTWSSQCFYDWGQYMRLALPTTMMISLQWWSNEIIMVMSSKTVVFFLQLEMIKRFSSTELLIALSIYINRDNVWKQSLLSGTLFDVQNVFVTTRRY